MKYPRLAFLRLPYRNRILATLDPRSSRGFSDYASARLILHGQVLLLEVDILRRLQFGICPDLGRSSSDSTHSSGNQHSLGAQLPI